MSSDQSENESGGPTPPRGDSDNRSVAQRIVRQLPRLGLLLFVVAMLLVFRAILLPFALAIFLAFLLYPVVSILESGKIGGWKLPEWLPGRRALAAVPPLRWQIPRWCAVVLIYTAFFTFSYHAVPRVVRSLASQLGQLQDTIPRTFATINQWQASVQEKVSDTLEVTKLAASTRDEILSELKDLQADRLEPPLSLPELAAPEDEKETAAATSGGKKASFSLFNIELHFGGDELELPPPTSAPGPAEDLEATDPADEPGPGEEGEDGASEDEETAEGEEEEIQLFDDAARDEAWNAILVFINEQLAKEGPAPAQLPEIAGEKAVQLGSEVLKLPRDDQRLLALRSHVTEHVRTAIRREEYIGEFEAESAAALQTARRWAATQLKKTSEWVTALLEGIFDFFLILMLTAFFLISFPRLISYVKDLVPPQYREDYTTILGRIDTRLNGAIRGQVIICLVNGVLTYPGLVWCGQLFDAPVLSDFAVLLSLVATVLSMIPIFGVILSTVPMVLLGLTQSLWAAIAVVAWICIIHAVEAYILNPHILGHSAQMNPILVVFALLAGKTFGGLVGALLAVPIASVVVALFGFYRRRMAEVYAAEAGEDVPADDWGD